MDLENPDAEEGPWLSLAGQQGTGGWSGIPVSAFIQFLSVYIFQPSYELDIFAPKFLSFIHNVSLSFFPTGFL